MISLTVKQIAPLLKESIELRIETFKIRNEQTLVFNKANDLSIKSLQARLKNDIVISDELWKKSIELRDEANKLAQECHELQELSGKLEKYYYRVIMMINGTYFDNPEDDRGS